MSCWKKARLSFRAGSAALRLRASWPCTPRVLVLDEPAAGLDPEGRDTILSQIRDYHEKTGITVLLVSHSMEDIAKYANRVLVMHRAKIAMMTRWKTSLPARRSCWSWGFRCRRSRRSFKAAPDGAGHPPRTSHDPLCGQNDSKGAGRQTGRWGKMLKDITIGQHFPGHSILHRCDPRLKLVATIASIVVLFVAPNPLGLALSILLLAALYKVAQIPGKMILKSLKPIVPIVIFYGGAEPFLRHGAGGSRLYTSGF